MHESAHAFGPDRGRMQRPLQRVAAQGGKRGKIERPHGLDGMRGRREYPHSVDMRLRSQWKFPSSKQNKLAQGRIAAGGSRRGNKSRGTRCNPQHQEDFGARELLRAIWKSLMAERRTSVNRSPCGRRTSHARGRESPTRNFSIPSPSNSLQNQGVKSSMKAAIYGNLSNRPFD